MNLHTRATCAAAAIASSLFGGPAIVTPNSGVTPTTVVTGHYGQIDVKTENNKVGHWGMILKTKDDTDMGTDSIAVAGGGFTGWHSHPSRSSSPSSRGASPGTTAPIRCAGCILTRPTSRSSKMPS